MLKQKLNGEHLIDYVWELINSKPTITIQGSVDMTAELFIDCIYMEKEEYDNGENCIVYDENGDELLTVNDIFVNQYTNEDYLQNIELYTQLNKILKKIQKSEKLILCE